jgi:hypothetical protein
MVLSGPNFETKLRLRYAERVILQELELASSISLDGDTSTIKTDKDDGQSVSVYSKYKPNKNPRRLPGREGDSAVALLIVCVHNSL